MYPHRSIEFHLSSIAERMLDQPGNFASRRLDPSKPRNTLQTKQPVLRSMIEMSTFVLVIGPGWLTIINKIDKAKNTRPKMIFRFRMGVVVL
jgi:hypothetical protein